MNWEGYAWYLWLITFGILEAIGLKRNWKSMTLTYFIEHHFQRWFLSAFIGWLAYHFLVSSPALH